MATEKGLAKAEYLVFIQSLPRVRNFICLLRWWFLYSNSSQSHLHTTSPALKSLSSPSPEIYYFTNLNMSGILLHLHFKPDKIIFRVTFFLEGNFKLNIFFPCYLSLSLSSPTSLSDCKSLTIKREAMIHCCHISLPGMWRGSALHFQLRSRLTENLLQAPSNIFIARISQVDHGFLQNTASDVSYHAPKKVR